MEVLTRRDASGLYIVTADEYRDDLAGPFKTPSDLYREAKVLGLVIKTAPRYVHQLAPGTRFRVDTEWYTLNHVNSYNAVANGITISRNTEVDEVR